MVCHSDARVTKLVFKPPFEYWSAIQMPGSTLVLGIWIANHLNNLLLKLNKSSIILKNNPTNFNSNFFLVVNAGELLGVPGALVGQSFTLLWMSLSLPFDCINVILVLSYKATLFPVYSFPTRQPFFPVYSFPTAFARYYIDPQTNTITPCYRLLLGPI